MDILALAFLLLLSGFVLSPKPGYYWTRHHRIVAVLPAGYASVRLGGMTYFYAGGIYYRPYYGRYVIVPENEVAPYLRNGAIPATPEEMVINVPNSDGTFTPVKLKRTENGYIGPQGELYTAHPTVEELKVLYGR